MSGAAVRGVVPLIEVGRRGAGRVSRTLGAPCTLRVGSSSACDLRVVARGVRARHLALEWDGFRLTILAEPGTGPVHQDGRPLFPPCVLSDGCTTLSIGDAEVRISIPESPEDEPTLVMDRDRTEVPPRRSDDPTDISERPPLPLDATTTQRVRHHRSRLDAVCAPLERADGRIRRVIEKTRAWVSRSSVALAAGVAIAGVAIAGVALSRRHAADVRGPVEAAGHNQPAPISAALATAVVPRESAGVAQPVATQTVAMPPAAAARLLASGRRHEAANAYGSLARARPGEPVFGALTKILTHEERAGESGQPVEGALP